MTNVLFPSVPKDMAFQHVGSALITTRAPLGAYVRTGPDFVAQVVVVGPRFFSNIEYAKMAATLLEEPNGFHIAAENEMDRADDSPALPSVYSIELERV